MSGPFGSTAWMANPASGFYDFPITNSVRINVGDSSFLSFTPSSAGNLRAWTWSGWIKRGNAPTAQNATFFSANNADNFRIVGAGAGSADVDTINLVMVDGSNNTTGVLDTLARFRDASSWYHFVIRWDVNNGTALNRLRLYVNGVQITTFSGDNALVDQNTDSIINSAVIHKLGAQQSSTTRDIDGYMAEVNFIDGTSLGPDSFGEFKSDIWIPKDTAGLTFGNQGWRLQFKQVGTGTASSSTIGADTSGNDNHWTSANLAASDVMPDSPTNNFATLNPSDPNIASLSITLSEGNLKATGTAYGASLFSSTAFLNTLMGGKWYYEQRMNDIGRLPRLGWKSASNKIFYRSNGKKNVDGTESSYGATFTDGDIISVAADVGSSTVEFFKNNASQGSISYTFVAGQDYTNAVEYGGPHGEEGSTFIMNFGQDSSFAGTETAQSNADSNGIGNFFYAPPSGFLAICTSNLPDPVETVDPNKGGSPQDYFSSVLYTGNGGDQTITGVGFQPDWTWIKHRTEAHDHVITDSVRPIDKILFSNGVDSDTSGGEITSFNSDGFVLEYSGTDTQAIKFNESSDTYVSWNWKAGTAFSNDASSTSVGNVDSAGTVNTDVGFSIINFVVTTDATMQIAHGLGKIPKMIISKNRDTNSNWDVYHSFVGNEHRLKLNSTAAIEDQDGVWADTTPTSSVFYQKGNGSWHAVGGNVLAYCFAEVDGYSKFGSYVGNGNADGTFVYTGFRPAFIIYKKTSGTGNWGILDNKKSPFNLNEAWQAANLQNAETNESARAVDFLSNGFKARGTNADLNTSSGTYIYMAFAEQPFKYANAR